MTSFPVHLGHLASFNYPGSPPHTLPSSSHDGLENLKPCSVAGEMPRSPQAPASSFIHLARFSLFSSPSSPPCEIPHCFGARLGVSCRRWWGTTTTQLAAEPPTRNVVVDAVPRAGLVCLYPATLFLFRWMDRATDRANQIAHMPQIRR